MARPKGKITAEWATVVRPDVVLRMPYETAQALKALTGSIGGDKEDSLLRPHTDLVYDVLHELGVQDNQELVSLDVKVELL